MRLERWSTTPGSNNATPPDGAPEGMFRTVYNDTLREIMAQIRTFYDAPEWLNFFDGPGPSTTHAVSRVSAVVARIAGIDLTAKFTPGRRIKVTGGATLFGSVNSSVFTAGNTDITVTMDGAIILPTPTSAIYANAIESMRQGATYNVGDVNGLIPLNTQSAALGTAAYKDANNTTGNVALHSQTGPLAAGAYKAVSNTVGDLAVHSATGPLLTLGYRALPGIAQAPNLSGDLTYTASAELAVIEGLAIPATPNGAKLYTIVATVVFANGGTGGDYLLSLHLGTVGTIAGDPVVLEIPKSVTAGNSDTFIALYLVQPAANTKVSIGFSGNHGGTIKGTTPRMASLTVFQFLN